MVEVVEIFEDGSEQAVLPMEPPPAAALAPSSGRGSWQPRLTMAPPSNHPLEFVRLPRAPPFVACPALPLLLTVKDPDVDMATTPSHAQGEEADQEQTPGPEPPGTGVLPFGLAKRGWFESNGWRDSDGEPLSKRFKAAKAPTRLAKRRIDLENVHEEFVERCSIRSRRE